MKIVLLFPGKIRPKVLAAVEREYSSRLRKLGTAVAEYKEERITTSRDSDQVKAGEATRILRQIQASDYVIACDERGLATTTEAMAELIRKSRTGQFPYGGKRRIVMVIGGALGLSESIRTRADAVWSLSSLIMAGGVARVVLLEGLYRAYTIVEGHPYHNA